MSTHRDKFFPGWKMTVQQHNAYFWHLGRAAKALNLSTSAERDELRAQIHVRAFGSNISAKEIDHLKMFDAFKAEILAITAPASVEAQLRQQAMPSVRLRHGILEKFEEGFILSILCSERFKKRTLADLAEMSEKDLTDLRNTLCSRAAGWREVKVPAPVEELSREEIRNCLEDEPAEVVEPDPF